MPLNAGTIIIIIIVIITVTITTILPAHHTPGEVEIQRVSPVTDGVWGQRPQRPVNVSIVLGVPCPEGGGVRVTLQWTPCQVPGIIGSALGQVGLVSVYCDWARKLDWQLLSGCGGT